MTRPFLKMNGLGNDFVVVEARSAPFAPSLAEAQRIADRETGIGCDQIIAIERSDKADAFMRIWNADGAEVGVRPLRAGAPAREIVVAWRAGSSRETEARLLAETLRAA